MFDRTDFRIEILTGTYFIPANEIAYIMLGSGDIC